MSLSDDDDIAREVLEAAELVLEARGDLIVIRKGRTILGTGASTMDAVVNAMTGKHSAVAFEHAQALFLAAALSIDVDVVFDVVESLIEAEEGDDDEEPEAEEPAPPPRVRRS